MPEAAPRILLIDDSRLALSATRQVLQQAGYPKALTANMVDQAFALLGVEADGFGPEGEIDLVLMDIVMPEMDGIEACRRIKDAPHLKDLPVIMVTARDDMESLERAFAAGAMDFISKPIREVELLARVRSALTLKREMDRRKANEHELAHLNRRLAEANRELRRLSGQDPLTGLANRRTYDDALDRQWRRCGREGTPLSVVMVDIDFFKSYNDLYGHQQGDQCLERVAQTLAGGTRRPHDMVARYGGEEFVVLLPATPQVGALQTAEALRRLVEGLGLVHEGSSVGPVVTVSLGVATQIPGAGDEAADLVEAADRALYEAKAKGRNRVAAQSIIAGQAGGERGGA